MLLVRDEFTYWESKPGILTALIAVADHVSSCLPGGHRDVICGPGRHHVTDRGSDAVLLAGGERSH